MKVLIISSLLMAEVFAGPGKVGNGDDGSDLEDFNEVKSGRLVRTQKLALKKIDTLNTKAIPKLGALGPELLNSKIYLTKKNISAEKLGELGAYHSGMQKLVYARTFAVPYSPTRFFPAAMSLSDSQLVTLHIHEALHRSLPEKFREDEKIVSEITLAIVSPGASFDSINKVTSKLLKEEDTSFFNRNLDKPAYLEAKVYKHVSRTSKNGSPNFVPLDLIYGVSSKVYPLKNKFSSVGMGLDLSFYKNNAEAILGPLGISLSGQVFTLKGFEGELYARWGRASGSSKKLGNALTARDNFRVGVRMFKDNGGMEFLNLIEFMKQHNEKDSFSGIPYEFEFGSITKAKISVLKKINNWGFGSSLKLFLIGPTSVSGGLTSSSPRGTILSLGPKLRYQGGKHLYSLGLNLPLSINDSNFNNIGDFIEGGVSQYYSYFSYKYLF